MKWLKWKKEEPPEFIKKEAEDLLLFVMKEIAVHIVSTAYEKAKSESKDKIDYDGMVFTLKKLRYIKD